jgi:hypothetical protein
MNASILIEAFGCAGPGITRKLAAVSSACGTANHRPLEEAPQREEPRHH